MIKQFIKSFKISSVAGFTLIEIIIVFTVLAILSVTGVVSYSNYNQSQIVNNDANGIGAAIKNAKSLALSQVKSGSVCSGKTLSGYQVQVYTKNDLSKPNTYELSAVCSDGTTFISATYKTAPNVSINSSVPGIFFSPVITGGITGGTITINGYSKTKTITVKSDGRIDIQ